MTALTQDRDTHARGDASAYTLPVEAATTVFAGALAGINANGNVVPMSSAIGLLCIGRAQHQANNSAGAAGAINVRVLRGVFAYNNSAGGDAISELNVGATCYAVDDNTVALTNGAGTRSIAGKIFDYDATTNQVWVDTRKPDVSKKYYLTLNLAALQTVGAAYYIASPVKGRITNLQVALEGALATGNATVTGKIGGVAITNGVVNLVQAGSAAGQVNTAQPTAANAVDINSSLSFTIGGTNTAAVAGMLTIEITE